MRRLALLLAAAAAATFFLRRRAPTDYVDVEFEDGSALRLHRGPEARALLDEAETILDAA